MNNKEKPIETVVRILNEAFALDPKAMDKLLRNRTYCNQALANHPTIQIKENETPLGKVWDVGTMGVLNGVVEALTGERVAAQVDEKYNLLGFQIYKKDEDAKS